MEPLTEHQLLLRMIGNVVGARDLMEKVGRDAEETPIPPWLELEIGRILRAVEHVEAQLRLEIA